MARSGLFGKLSPKRDPDIDISKVSLRAQSQDRLYLVYHISWHRERERARNLYTKEHQRQAVKKQNEYRYKMKQCLLQLSFLVVVVLLALPSKILVEARKGLGGEGLLQRPRDLESPKLGGESLKTKRVHFVDRVGNNGFFRGNEPIANGSQTFSYQAVVDEIKKKALQEANWALPDKFFLVDLSFESIEFHDINTEKSFFDDNPELGAYREWSLFGVPFPVSSVENEDLRKRIAQDIWFADKLPERLSTLRHDLETWNNSMPVIVYGHCEAGCDRTGEFIGSYLMQYKNKTITESWQSDTSSCGREPYKVSQYAMEWYCEYLKLQGGYDQLDTCTIDRTDDVTIQEG